MTPRLAFLGAERGPEAVDATERHGRRLVVELSALREVGLFAEVLRFEQGGCALARAGREDRGVHVEEALAVHEVAEGGDDLGAHAQDRLLARRTQPQVAVIHQEVGAVLLGSDRIALGHRDHAHRLKPHLDAPGGARVRAQDAADHERGLLGEAVTRLPLLRRQILDSGHALHHPGPVPHQQELDLAARPSVREPAPQLDGAARMRGCVPDRDPGQGARGVRGAHEVAPHEGGRASAPASPRKCADLGVGREARNYMSQAANRARR